HFAGLIETRFGPSSIVLFDRCKILVSASNAAMIITTGNNEQTSKSGSSERRLRSLSQSRKASPSTKRAELDTSIGRTGFSNRQRTAQVKGIVASTYLFSSAACSSFTFPDPRLEAPWMRLQSRTEVGGILETDQEAEAYPARLNPEHAPGVQV